MTSITFPLPLIATAFWLLAFACSFPWLSAYETEFLIASLSALFIGMALNDGAGIARREWPVPVSSVLIAGGLFWLTALISVATSDILYVSWIYFFFFSALPLTTVFFLVGQDAEARLRLAWQGIRIVLAGLSIFALVQYFFYPDLLTSIGRVHEPLADPNSLAAVLSLGMFLLASRFLRSDVRPCWHDLVLMLFLTGAFLAAGSRGAVLSLLFMGAAFVGLIGIRTVAPRTWFMVGAIAVVVLLGVGLITPRAGLGPFYIFSHSLVNAFTGAFADRGEIWSATWQIIRDHLWLGTGIGTFQFYYAEVRPMADVTYGYMAHNDPLQFAAELGLAAPLLFYSVIGLAVVRTRAALKLVPRGDVRRVDILAPLFGLGALALHSHLTYNFHVLPCLIIAGFAFALWYQRTAMVLAETPRLITAPVWMNKTALESLFMVVAFAMIVLVAAPVYTQRLVREADSDLKNGRLTEFAYKVNLADTLSLGTNPQAYVLAAAIPLGVMEQTQKPLTAEERESFLIQAADILERAGRSNPRDPDILIQKAQLANLKNDPQSAEGSLREALKLDPLHLGARMALGDQLVKNGKADEAVEVMNAGLDRIYGPARASQYMEYFIKTMALQEEQAKRKAK